MSTQIFLYITGGRTLWVPSHTAAASETRPIHILNFVTPSELSRSFYLFDFPVMLVDHARHAAGNPHARVPQDVLAAVNEFRRVCAEDQNFLLERCYNPHKPASSNAGAHGNVSANTPNNNNNNNNNTNVTNSNAGKPSILDSNMYHAAQAHPPSISPAMGVGNNTASTNNNPGTNANPIMLAPGVGAGAGAGAVGAVNSNNNNFADVLTQLLQQQQQQHQQAAASSSTVTPLMHNNMFGNSTMANMYGNVAQVPPVMAGPLSNAAGAANSMPLMNMLGGMPGYTDGSANRYLSPNMGGGPAGAAGMPMNAMPNFANPGGAGPMPMMMPSQAYMRGGQGGQNNPYHAGAGMRGRGGMYGHAGGGPNDRRRMAGGYNNNNMNTRLPHYSMHQQQQQQSMHPRGGARGGGNNNNNFHNTPGMGNSVYPMPGTAPGPFNGAVRSEPEPIDIKVTIPPEVLATYTNPSQQLVCATMPGPRMTVWLREHEPPKDTSDRKYVFCRGGIILMLKAKGEEVVASKPVELFGKQICTHFLIHGVCSRSYCLHEHHSEEQLRQLIAARHVELKAMTKKQRHELIHQIMEKEKEGLAQAEAERAERQKQHSEVVAARQAAGHTRGRVAAGGEHGNAVATASLESAGVGVGVGGTASQRTNMELSSDDENHHGSDGHAEKRNKSSRRTGSAPSHSQRTAGENELASSSSARGGSRATAGGEQRDGEESERSGVTEAQKSQSSRIASRLPSSRLDNLGVTDSEDDDDDDDASSTSSSSSSSSSASSSRSRHSDVGKTTKRRVMKRSDSTASSSSSSSSSSSTIPTRKRRTAEETTPRARTKRNRADAAAAAVAPGTQPTERDEQQGNEEEEKRGHHVDGATQVVHDRVEDLVPVEPKETNASHNATPCRSVNEEDESRHDAAAHRQPMSANEESVTTTKEEDASVSESNSKEGGAEERDGASSVAESTPPESSDQTQSTEEKSGDAEECSTASANGSFKKVAPKKRGRPAGTGAKKSAGASKK